MACDLSEERLIEYLYGEIDPAEKAQVEVHLDLCRACREALENLTRTSRILRAWPDEDPGMRAVFVREQAPFWKGPATAWLAKRDWRRFATGLAAGLAAAALILLFVDFRVESGQGALQVSLRWRSEGSLRAEEDPLNRPVTLRDIAGMQQITLGVIQAMLRESEDRQRQEFGYAVARLARDFDLRRREDMQQVGYGLQAIGRSADYRLRQTDGLLEQLITLTALQMPEQQPQMNLDGRR